MPKPVSRRELIRKLRKIEFVGPFQGGRHQFMKRHGKKMVIPNPHGRDLGSIILSQIIRELNISAKEFENL